MKFFYFLSRQKGIFTAVFSLVVLGGVFWGGVYVGYENRSEVEKVVEVVNKESLLVIESEQVDFEPFWQTWRIINERFAEANGTTSPQDKVWGAAEGLVGSLDDPYSIFLPPSDARIFEENIAGNFGGVGMEIGMRNGIVTVIAPLKDTPAERAGILASDQIVGIDGESTADFNIDDAVKLIRGEIGTAVILTILREGESAPLDVEVVRDTIKIPTIETELREDGIFVIELYNFSGTAAGLFRNALREFVLSGTDKLIVDLRGNPGGFLEVSVDTASWFLPAGKIVAIEDFGGRKEQVLYRSKGYDIFNENLKMVVLVDRGSASASEIFAGALSDHGVATIIGEETFGKGSVQELFDIADGASLKLTIAHWLTPSGVSISKSGITPDIVVERTAEDLEEGADPQREKAVEILLTDN